MSKPRLSAAVVAIVFGVFVLATTGCAPMHGSARYTATWPVRLDLALIQDRHRIRTDIVEERSDLPAATAAYVRHLRRGEQQRVLGTDTVRRLLDDMAAELRGTCDVCVVTLERERAGLDVDRHEGSPRLGRFDSCARYRPGCHTMSTRTASTSAVDA